MYSLFGVLIYFAALIPTFIFALDGQESVSNTFWAIPFVVVNLPLAFMLYHDVHKRMVHTKKIPRANVLYEPVVWIFFAGFFGFFAGITYFHMTAKEKPLPPGVSDADQVAFIVFSWIFAVAAGFVLLYQNRTLSLFVIGLYALLNLFAIHTMRKYKNYTGVRTLVAGFMVFLILYFSFGGL
jgi:hypothetical protein